MFVICCVKSKTTYNRIVNMFPSFEWEEYFFNIDEIRERLVFSEYSFAIVDKELHWVGDLIEVFEARNIPIIYFEKDFSKLEAELKEWQAKMITEKAKDNKSVEKPADEEKHKYESNVKIVSKIVEKIVEVPVYKPLYSPLQRRVAVFSLSERAGSSFMVVNLAKALSARNISVTVVELPYQAPYIFDSVGLINSINEDNAFVSYPHIIADGSRDFNKDNVMIVDDIFWVVIDPQLSLIDLGKWNFEKSMMLLDVNRDSAVTLIDAGYSVPLDVVKELLVSVDIAFVIVDCYPADIMSNYLKLKTFTQLKNDGKQVFFIFNKFNPGINKKHLLSYMKVDPLAYVPYINPEYIYKCAYSAQIPYDLKEIKDILDPSFSAIIKTIVPPELFVKISGDSKNLNKANRKGLLSSLLNKKEDKENE